MKRSRVIAVFLYCFLVAASSIGARSATLSVPLPITVAVGARQFRLQTRLAVSPDGRFVAYALQDGTRILEPFFGTYHDYTKSGVPAFSQGCDVWLTDLRTGRTSNLTAGFGSSWEPAWSSDGRYLAFLSDRGGNVHLWIWDRASGESRQVSTAIVHQAGATTIHWVDQNRKLLVPLLPTGMSVADADAFSSGYVIWHGSRPELSHSTVHVYVNDPKVPNNTAMAARLQGYDGSSNGDPFDYALVDVASGAVTRILPRSTALALAISDDQRYALLMSQSGSAVDAPSQALYDLDVIALPSARAVLSIHNVPMASSWIPSWQPGADGFMYTPGSRSAQVATKRYGTLGQTHLVSVATGRSRIVTLGEHPTFGMYSSSAIWSPSGNRLYYIAQNQIWIANVSTGVVHPLPWHSSAAIRTIVTNNGDRALQRGNLIYALTLQLQTKQESIVAIDINSGRESARLFQGGNIGGAGNLIAASASGGEIVYVWQDSDRPWDVWAVPLSLRGPRRLTDLNPNLERYTYGKARLIGWRLPDGTQDQGILLLPSDYIAGHRYPTVIFQYPADRKSNNLHVFGGDDNGTIWGNFQLYATRGFAVFMPDEIWKSQTEADITNGRAMPWLNSMLDKLVGLGISDPQRFGIEGLSNGGYSTLAFITQTNRFKAAIDDSGLPSWLTPYTEFSQNGDAFYVNQQEGDTGGTPWHALNQYIAMSPFFKFDRVMTPLMIVQGSGAIWVQQKEGDETFVGLRRLDKEVTYVIYEDDGHSRWSWIYPHEVDYWTRAISWYKRHLK